MQASGTIQTTGALLAGGTVDANFKQDRGRPERLVLRFQQRGSNCVPGGARWGRGNASDSRRGTTPESGRADGNQARQRRRSELRGNPGKSNGEIWLIGVQNKKNGRRAGKDSAEGRRLPPTEYVALAGGERRWMFQQIRASESSVPWRSKLVSWADLWPKSDASARAEGRSFAMGAAADG